MSLIKPIKGIREVFPDWVDFNADLRRLFDPQAMSLIIQWDKEENSLRLNFIDQTDIDRVVPLKHHRNFIKLYNYAVKQIVDELELNELLDCLTDNTITDEFINTIHVALFHKINYEFYGINVTDESGLKEIALRLRHLMPNSIYKVDFSKGRPKYE